MVGLFGSGWIIDIISVALKTNPYYGINCYGVLTRYKGGKVYEMYKLWKRI